MFPCPPSLHTFADQRWLICKYTTHVVRVLGYYSHDAIVVESHGDMDVGCACGDYLLRLSRDNAAFDKIIQ